jgi:hypothetical protein
VPQRPGRAPAPRGAGASGNGRALAPLVTIGTAPRAARCGDDEDEESSMTIDPDLVGPVDVAVIGFTGDAFNGEIIPALNQLVDSDTVRIIDLVFIRKAADGSTDSIEVTDAQIADALQGLQHSQHDLLNDEDLELLSQSLDPATAALVIVWENRWAARFAEAVRGSNGFLVSHDRIPRDVVESAIAALNE